LTLALLAQSICACASRASWPSQSRVLAARRQEALPGAHFLMVKFTVSDNPSLSGPGNTVDYMLFPVIQATGVPGLSLRGGLLTAALMLAATCVLVRQQRGSRHAST